MEGKNAGFGSGFWAPTLAQMLTSCVACGPLPSLT